MHDTSEIFDVTWIIGIPVILLWWITKDKAYRDFAVFLLVIMLIILAYEWFYLK